MVGQTKRAKFREKRKQPRCMPFAGKRKEKCIKPAEFDLMPQFQMYCGQAYTAKYFSNMFKTEYILA